MVQFLPRSTKVFAVSDDYFSKKNIYEAGAPFYYLQRLFGVMSFQIHQVTGQIRIRLPIFLWFCTVLFILCLMVIATSTEFYTDFVINHDSSTLAQKALRMFCILNLVGIICCLLLNFTSRNIIGDFLKTLNAFDEMVSFNVNNNCYF